MASYPNLYEYLRVFVLGLGDRGKGTGDREENLTKVIYIYATLLFF